MPLAEKSILALLKIQDMDERSKTYGLWSYLLEENLQQMLTPDFNWANFISNQLAYVLKKRSHYLSEELKQKLIISLIAAAECTKRRNGCGGLYKYQFYECRYTCLRRRDGAYAAIIKRRKNTVEKSVFV